MDPEKLKFINDELEEWALWIDGRLREKFQKMKIGVTDELLRSLSYQVFNSSGLNDGEYQLSFLEYGRMVDMGSSRGVKHGIAENARAYRKAGEQKMRKAKKFYSRTTYGGISRLMNSIINGYQPAIAETIKEGMT